jgi:hypothetical protein
MKITLLTPALVAILSLAFVTTSVKAADTTTTAPAAAATTPVSTKVNKVPYKGTAISATSVTISGKETLTLAIDDKTKFAVSKKKATAADFAVGDAITGSYTKDDAGALTAASIHKKAAK